MFDKEMGLLLLLSLFLKFFVAWLVAIVGPKRSHQILSFFEKRLPFAYRAAHFLFRFLTIKKNRIRVFIVLIGLGGLNLDSYALDSTQHVRLLNGLLLVGIGLYFLWNERRKPA